MPILRLNDTPLFEDLISDLIAYPPVKKKEGQTAKKEIGDDIEPALKFRITDKGDASWYAYVYDTVAKNKSYKKLGGYKDLTLEVARRKAAELRESVARMNAGGISYVAEQAEFKEERLAKVRTGELTLRNELETYIENRDLSVVSKEDYRQIIYRACDDKGRGSVMDWPLSKFTLEWFEDTFKWLYSEAYSQAWKFRRVFQAVLAEAWIREPSLFAQLPVTPEKKLKKTFRIPKRKAVRVDYPFLPEIRVRLKAMDDYYADLAILILLTGLRVGAVMSLRFDQTCNQKTASGREKWAKGIIEVLEAPNKPLRELPVSKQVQGILLRRFRLHGEKTPWVFWNRGNKLKKIPEDFSVQQKDYRWLFLQLDVRNNHGKVLMPHDLRRTFNNVCRNILAIDPLIAHVLMLHSTKSLNVNDGYAALDTNDLLRATQRISDKMVTWMNSTREAIEEELGVGTKRLAEIEEFSL